MAKTTVFADNNHPHDAVVDQVPYQHIPNFKSRLKGDTNPYPLIYADGETRQETARRSLEARKAQQKEVERRMALLPGLGRDG